MQPSSFVKIATIGLFSVGSFSIFSLSFLFTKTSNNTQTAQIITDISRYSEIRNHQWSNVHQIQHFPTEIPIGAKTISMAYSPGVMQGSSFFQVRLQKSPEQIQKLLNYYSKIAEHKYFGGDTNSHIKKYNGVPTTFFYTGESENESFPSTYKILVLKAQPQGESGFKWKHGNSYGVAISSSSSEIVYWAEKW